MNEIICPVTGIPCIAKCSPESCYIRKVVPPIVQSVTTEINWKSHTLGRDHEIPVQDQEKLAKQINDAANKAVVKEIS